MSTAEPTTTLTALAHRLVVPALRWDGSAYRVAGSDASPVELVKAGVAGFILFGGTAAAASALLAELRAGTERPLLFGADLERGAGQQFDGATRLPPAGALGDLDDVTVTRAAGELTGREARSLGIDMVFAPVADVAADPDNPIVGPRAFSADAEVAARHVAAWVEGALAAGVLPCVKHFPGHGRASGDSHVGQVRVDADASTLDHDLAPFRAAIEAGVPLVMPGHLVVPALDPAERIGTVSEAMLAGLLRDRMGFDGALVTDALLMAGAGDLADTVVGAMRAGVDLLLYPESVGTAVAALAEAAESDPTFAARLAAARGRAEALAARIPTADQTTDVGAPSDVERGTAWAAASVRRIRGDAPAPGPDAHLTTIDVDDDVGGPFPPPSRAPFHEALDPGAGPGSAPGSLSGANDPGVVEAGTTLVVALWADTRGWKGRAGLSTAATDALARAIDAAPVPASMHVVVFGGPRAAEDVPEGPTVWLAWGGEELMQVAAARSLRARPA